jgi:type II secretion system protein G
MLMRREQMLQRKQKGFTLIERLIVVAIIGILAPIAIPNLLTAIQRSKQKRMMADMRSIATAWEARATDTNSYTSAGYTTSAGKVVTQAALEGLVTPTYIRTLPSKDGWSNAWGCSTNTSTNAQIHQIVSGGRDGKADGTNGPTTQFDCDIVYTNGQFIAFPEGAQSAEK